MVDEFAAIGVAAADNDLSTVKLHLLVLGQDPSEPDARGWTPLHHAALHGATEAARLLLAHGAAVDARNQDGVTPLACAVYGLTRPADLVALLRSHRADPYAADRIGRTPRHWAAIDPGGDPLADLPVPSPFPRRPDLAGSDHLTTVELEAVRAAVVAVVDRQGDDDELYTWVREAGARLRVPFGPSRTWDLHAMNGAVDVTLWTVAEGPSDLTLSLHLDGTTATARDLHVL